MDWAAMERSLAQRLSERRLQHVYGVVAAARHLARSFAVPEDQARAAALMHDYAKDMPLPELLDHASRFGLLFPSPADTLPELLHGPVGAALAAHEGLIDDTDVLAAIRWHTTGRAGMSPLEVLVWVADKIEPGRSFPGVQAMREAAKRDLYAALRLGLDGTIVHLVRRGRRLQPDSIACRNWLLGRAAGK